MIYPRGRWRMWFLSAVGEKGRGAQHTGYRWECCWPASLTDVGADLARRRVPLELDGDAPEELLVGLVDEAIMRLDADGDLPVALTDVTPTTRGLRGTLEVVDLAAVRVHGVAPKAATWHEVRLEPVDDGWQGYLMLDL